jgi:organic radical activating enzyme
VKEIFAIKDLTPNDFNIKWRMTNLCNIHCSYCIRYKHRVDINDTRVKENEDKLCEVARDISKLLEKTKFNNIRLNLIGGEVTIFDLKRILANITTDKVKVISITSNFMRNTQYYLELADYCHSRNIELSIRLSCHYEFITLDKYFEKITQLKGKIDYLTCEIVSSSNNQDLCKDFISRCEKIKVNYLLDADIRQKQVEARKKGLLTNSKTYDKRNPRYKISFTDGTEEIFETRNQFLTSKEIKGTKDLKFIQTGGMYCTNSYNYIYIDFDKVNGRSSPNSDCHELIPINDFKLLESPAICRKDYCTICGHMDLFREL